MVLSTERPRCGLVYSGEEGANPMDYQACAVVVWCMRPARAEGAWHGFLGGGVRGSGVLTVG